MKPEHIDLKRDSSGWYLESKDGKFRNEHGRVRYWRTAGSATVWLRRTAERLNRSRVDSVGWVVTNQATGYVSHVGEALEESAHGPHSWFKKNVFTQQDPDGSTYDTWQCRRCKKIVSLHGLSGGPSGGVCRKNIL